MQGAVERTEMREWLIIENGGVRLFGVLHRPLQVENPPVVVMMHGFASSKHGSKRCYVTLAETFAKKGIAAVRFDFRGCGDSEGSLTEASFQDLVSDGVTFCASLGKVEGIDASRLGIFGASLGGALAVEVSALSQKTRALALWAPVASGEIWFRDFLTKNPHLTRHEADEILGTHQGIEVTSVFRAQFAELFAHKTLAKLQAVPLLHMHGSGDEAITLSHQKAYKETAGAHATFITYPDAQHSLGFSKVFSEVAQQTVRFFKEHLS